MGSIDLGALGMFDTSMTFCACDALRQAELNPCSLPTLSVVVTRRKFSLEH